jgi:hypothetical protein
MGSWLRFLLVDFWQNFAKMKTLHCVGFYAKDKIQHDCGG